MNEKRRFPGREELTEICELPDPFMMEDGRRVKTDEDWAIQREYLKAMLNHYLYGETPPPPKEVKGDCISSELCFDGSAIREKIRLTDERGLKAKIEVLRPSEDGPHPVIVYNCMDGYEHPTAEEDIIKKGYAVLLVGREQFAPDIMGAARFDGGAFRAAYPEYKDARAIAIWGWACSYCATFLESQPWAENFLVTGFSRGGKAALRAAAWDERFLVCLLNSSGTGGGGCFRYWGQRMGRNTGEVEGLGSMTSREKFWYWFCDEIQSFGNPSTFGSMGGESFLPFDLHTVRALVAPRAILCTEGLDDPYSNYYGTQVAWRAAQEVYEFLGVTGKNALAYFEGGHDYSPMRWQTVLDFSDVILRDKPQRIPYRRFEKDVQPNPSVIQDVPPLHFSWRAPKNNNV